MTNPSPLETHVAALISAYADQAPVDIDPVAMTRLAAAGRRERATVLPGFGVASPRLGFALLALALLVTIVGTVFMAGGRSLLPDREVDLAERGFVEPFLGLPAAGAMPSTPETGEPVFSFDGRVYSLGLDFYRMWVYADGRLIWKSNLEGSGRKNPAFGSNEPTTAVIEQRLTPLGVELLRSEVMAAASILGPARVGDNLTRWGRPGVLWGGMAIGAGDQILAASWDDRRLPARLANPASWLPASAWADQRVGGFVPAHYAICVEPISRDSPVGALPARTQALIHATATTTGDPRCGYRVTLADARAIAESLGGAGLRREGSDLRWSLRDDRPYGWVELLPIVPNGEFVCNCG